MSTNNKNGYIKSSVDFYFIISLVIENKKIIIISLLFFIITSIFYTQFQKTSFQSTSYIETGYFEHPDGTKKLIEPASSTIRDINLDMLVNNKYNSISLDRIENNLIRAKISSFSDKKNEEILTNLIVNIIKKHNKISHLSSESLKNPIKARIAKADDRITYFKAQLSEQHQAKYIKLLDLNTDKVQHISQSWEMLRLNDQIKNEIFKSTQQKNTLLDELNNLENKNLIKTKASDIEIIETKPKYSTSIFIGFIIGLLSSLLYISILKSYAIFKKSYLKTPLD
jgi:hypothetical protein